MKAARPTQLALSLNLTVMVAAVFSMPVYFEAAGPTAFRYLPLQQSTPQGFALL
jgi:hypothetical protein